jgi:hypothetical protein
MADVIRVAIARPAASSLAELIRKPVDNLSEDCAICPSESLSEFCAITAFKFVLITGMMIPQVDEFTAYKFI